ncbi:two-component regulator propeller domain-containing protein [Gelidibacter japonicus]|jgi:signal transduction histidine kinase/ligand-binding sensor domain-containing protein/DNA-binding response OmpR family regulator|uniref:two-component regulator propeller domain-containing protein n=1 Tax=Gelidibacter japonicus TaxID=1962232 RepID=UPI002AFFBF59|nr:two-component regulator propeller domain-containing protein [Gelidibacter japonicus]
MQRIKIILIFLVLLSNLVGFGQTVLNDNQKLKFKHYSLTEGLSQSSVLCIFQDSKGFMWFGTRDGLNKFDGQNFTTYRHNSQDSTSISNSYIKSLIEDNQGNLWVGTMNGLNKYVANGNKFERFKQSDGKNSISNNEIWDMVSTKDGDLWLGTNFGLERFDPKTHKASHFEPKDKNRNSNSQIRSLLVTSDGNLWICNTKNIEVYDPQSKTYNEYNYPLGETKEVNKNYAPIIYEDDQNNLLLGYKNGLFLFDPEGSTFKPYQLKSTTNPTIQDEVRSISQDYLNNLWIGTYNGLYLIHKKGDQVYHYVHDENDLTSLSQNSIYSIYEDVRGDFWIGTYAGGVNYYDRSYDVFKSFSAGANDLKLNYMVVSSIIEDPNQNLIIGTEGGGINVYNHTTGRFTYYTHNDSNTNSLSTDNVKAMIRTSDGNYWVGMHDGGINVLNLTKQPYTFKKYVNHPTDSMSLSSNRIISLFEDARQDVWIGTSGGGLNKWQHDTQSIIRIKAPSSTIGSIIYAITPMRNKNSLLVSSNKGLAKINILTHEWTPLPYKKAYQNTDHIHATLYAYEDPFQNIWVATEGDGLYHYDPKTQESTKYGMSNGLPNEVIYGILPDDFNTIWLSTNNGLSRLDPAAKTFTNFDVSDGLVSNEFNYGAFKKLSNGDLMFGSANGITYFNPNDIIKNTFVPPVSITSFMVNNQPFFVDTETEKVIQLKHYQNAVSFNFVALSYSQPNKNQYAFKLEGFDNEWINIGNKKSATYTNLDSGIYTFRVKAANNDGLWNEEGASMSFTIKPAPWLTWWAYLIYAILIVTILLIIRKYSLIRIHEKNELKFERQEKERIEEINQMKLRLFTNVSHDFRTPLTLIIGPLERMLHKKIGSAYIQRQHEIMHRNASVLLQLINQLLDFRKSESGQLKLTASEGNIVPFIKNIKMSFDELARLRGIDYHFHTEDDSIELWFDNIDLKKVIYNLLSNAFKFTPKGGQVSISLSKVAKMKSNLTAKEFLRLEVKDSGRGVPKENLKFIFDRFYQLGQDDTTRSGTGIGLALTKSIVELHHGKIKAKSNEGEGTTFIVLLPLGNAHLSETEMTSNQDTTSGSFYFNSPNYMIKDLLPEDLDEDNEELENNISEITILIVEDNVEVRLFIKSIFELSYDILEAENGEMAIEIANNHRVDLIISDVMMPKMDGIEMCHHIKSNILTSHIPVLLLTAKTSEDAQRQGYETGADAYITKPFDANILELKVNNLLMTRKRLIEKFRKDIILEPSKPKVTSPDEIFLQKAIALVEAHINDSEYSINDFVNEMGMSRSALYRKLKAVTDQSITEFIRTIKLKRAGQLILQTDLNISEIAFDLGFNDLKHFRKSFQILFDELPSEYRAKYNQDSDNAASR